MDYNSLRDAYFKSGLTQQLYVQIYELLYKGLVPMIVNARLPNYLAPEKDWGERSIQGLLHECLGNKRINIPQLLDQCDSERMFLRFAERNFRQHLFNQKEPSEKDNLFRRIKAILEKNRTFREFVSVSSSWGLAEWLNPEPWDLSEEDLFRATHVLANYKLRLYKPGSPYNSPLISKQDLQELLISIFGVTQKRITISQLVNLIAAKLNAFHHSDVVFEQEPDTSTEEGGKSLIGVLDNIGDDSQSVADTLETIEIVESIIKRTNGKKLRAFYEMSFESTTLRTVADLLNVSGQTVKNYQVEVGKILEQESKGDGWEARHNLCKSLLRRLDDIYSNNHKSPEGSL